MKLQPTICFGTLRQNSLADVRIVISRSESDTIGLWTLNPRELGSSFGSSPGSSHSEVLRGTSPHCETSAVWDSNHWPTQFFVGIALHLRVIYLCVIGDFFFAFIPFLLNLHHKSTENWVVFSLGSLAMIIVRCGCKG